MLREGGYIYIYICARTRHTGVGFVQKRWDLRSTSHLCNNAADNGQRASSVSLKHALNSRGADELAETERERESGVYTGSNSRALRASPNPSPPSPPVPLFFCSPDRVRDGHVWLKRRKVCPRDPFQQVVVLFVRRKRKQKRRGGGCGEEAAERDRKREDRLPGLNWNCHVRASEANQRKKQLV